MIETIKEAVNKAFINQNYELNQEIVIEVPKEKNNGDFSSNICLKMAKKLELNPMFLAEKIKSVINNERIIKIEIKEPGFLNFFVNKDYLYTNLIKVIKQNNDYGKNNIGQGQKINYEYVSANPTGILHTGNARGGAYGDNMARILSFSGYDVTREYYINDAGNQVNNLGLSIKARYFEFCHKNSKMPEDGYFGQEIIDLAQKLYEEHQDKLLTENVEFFTEYGIKNMINRIIDDLKIYGVEFDILTSEKDIYNKNLIEKVIETLKDKNYIYEKENATWFKSSELLDDKDHVLIKADGSYTYLVPDIAYHVDKLSRGYAKLVDILGTDHHGYVNRIKSGLMALGYEPEILDIKLLQLVRLVKDGKEVKMSKRTGNSISLKELVEEIGKNAARYYFASRSLDTQMEIDLDMAIKKSNENPVYYVSYAYARICTILNNYPVHIIESFKLINKEKIEDVVEKIFDFSKVVEDAALKEMPHLITNYVYSLASSFHYLYNDYRFVDENNELTNENLNLLLAIKITMYNALSLIGVVPPEKM